MLHPALLKRDSAIQGSGLFATAFIPKGTIIWEQDARDQQFTYDEYVQQPPDIQRLCHVYHDLFVLAVDDAEVMNHSCDPNAACLGDEAVVTIRDVLPGEEVTYDYATSEINERIYVGWECGCGAANCRKVITSDDCLNPAFQQRYAGHLPSWTIAYIQKHQQAAGAAL